MRDGIEAWIWCIGLAACGACGAFACASSRVPAYERALTSCRERGKDAGTYAVYEACAEEADAKYGKKDGGP